MVWNPNVTEQFMDPLPDEFWNVRNRAVDLLGLQGFEEDPYKGSFLTYVAPGGSLHEHRDARLTIRQEEFLILRCNVLFKKPQEGGVPVIDSHRIDVGDRGLWAFFPTELTHSATEVTGTEPRGTLSFGFLVRPADLWRRRFRIAPGAEWHNKTSLEDGSAAATMDGHQQPSPLYKRLLDVLRFAASQNRDFSVHEAALALGQEPSEVGAMVSHLQGLNFFVSYSSAYAKGGRVLLI